MGAASIGKTFRHDYPGFWANFTKFIGGIAYPRLAYLSAGILLPFWESIFIRGLTMHIDHGKKKEGGSLDILNSTVVLRIGYRNEREESGQVFKVAPSGAYAQGRYKNNHDASADRMGSLDAQDLRKLLNLLAGMPEGQTSAASNGPIMRLSYDGKEFSAPVSLSGAISGEYHATIESKAAASYARELISAMGGVLG